MGGEGGRQRAREETADVDQTLNLTTHWIGAAALATFLAAYGAVMAEEYLQLRKSQPVLLAAGVVWLLIGIAYAQAGDPQGATAAAEHNLLEFAELFLFLLVAMTYVNTMEERGLFEALRAWLVGRGLSLRALFWVTGVLAFFFSPIVDNLTTALLMGAVAVTVGQGRPRFVTLACINVVVAANAGGAFSPFGDITTLLVWQAGLVSFFGFFALIIPSVVNWLVPAAIMSFAVEPGHPMPLAERPVLAAGSVTVVVLFLGTIATTVAFQQFLQLPAALGMMAGLGVLKMYSYVFNQVTGGRHPTTATVDEMDDVFASPQLVAAGVDLGHGGDVGRRGTGPTPVEGEPAGPRPPSVERERAAAVKPLDIFAGLERLEWDTLMFFFGVILCVGGLGTLGYLGLASQVLYLGLGPTAANVLIGLLSAVVDNVPVMFAVLTMQPEMSQGQWLLVTLTAGVGGSLLSLGSAAGVALMGQARGVYTFMAHLKWTWAIALGYAASIGVHLLLNRHLF
ncbi:MAG: sodium:proton antiporter NhaD [Chloroflexota bacterium]